VSVPVDIPDGAIYWPDHMAAHHELTRGGAEPMILATLQERGRIVCLTEETTETLYLLGEAIGSHQRLHGSSAEARQGPRSRPSSKPTTTESRPSSHRFTARMGPDARREIPPSHSRLPHASVPTAPFPLLSTARRYLLGSRSPRHRSAFECADPLTAASRRSEADPPCGKMEPRPRTSR